MALQSFVGPWSVFQFLTVGRDITITLTLTFTLVSREFLKKSVKRRLGRCSWRIPTLRSPYQVTAVENTADWKDLECSVVTCKLYKLAEAPNLSVVANRVLKWSINTISGPKTPSIVTHTCGKYWKNWFTYMFNVTTNFTYTFTIYETFFFLSGTREVAISRNEFSSHISLQTTGKDYEQRFSVHLQRPFPYL
jgi:hypothetical protein